MSKQSLYFKRSFQNHTYTHSMRFNIQPTNDSRKTSIILVVRYLGRSTVIVVNLVACLLSLPMLIHVKNGTNFNFPLAGYLAG